jgi:hypothetical protein
MTVEDLITGESKLKLDVSVAYANSENDGVKEAGFITLQTGENSFTKVLSTEGISSTNTLVGTLGIRYGLTQNLEVYTRGSYLYSYDQSIVSERSNSVTEKKFVSAWLGANYQFSADNDTPALLGFIEVSAYERHQKEYYYNRPLDNRSLVFGVTAYRAIDPVVISLTTSIGKRQALVVDSISYKPANYLLINPTVAVALNDTITLSSGFQWMLKDKDEYNGVVQNFRQTSTHLLLGVGYGVSKGNTFRFTFRTTAAGQQGADLRLNWLYAI